MSPTAYSGRRTHHGRQRRAGARKSRAVGRTWRARHQHHGLPRRGQDHAADHRPSRALAGRLRVGVIEGDVASDVDADKIRAAGVPAVQINTGGGCHLDAPQVRRASSSSPAGRARPAVHRECRQPDLPGGLCPGRAHPPGHRQRARGRRQAPQVPAIFAARGRAGHHQDWTCCPTSPLIWPSSAAWCAASTPRSAFSRCRVVTGARDGRVDGWLIGTTRHDRGDSWIRHDDATRSPVTASECRARRGAGGRLSPLCLPAGPRSTAWRAGCATPRAGVEIELRATPRRWRRFVQRPARRGAAAGAHRGACDVVRHRRRWRASAFEILAQPAPQAGGYQLISPDIATCPDCLREILRPGRSALPLSVYQLHQLRPALYHHRGRALRPAAHHHARLCACARPASASTTTRWTAAFTPSPTPARSAGRS